MAGTVCSKWAKGTGGPAGDEIRNLICPPVSPAIKARDYKGQSSDGYGDGQPLIAHSLRAERFDASEDGTGRGTPIVPVAYPIQDAGREKEQGGSGVGAANAPMYTLDQMSKHAVAFNHQSGGSAMQPSPIEDGANTLQRHQQQQAVMGNFGVRRLTPRECERLQGFPDDWTAVNGMKDGPRYRMLGNAVAVPVAAWIGRRIVVARKPVSK